MWTKRFVTGVLGVFVVIVVYEYAINRWLLESRFYTPFTPRLFQPEGLIDRRYPWIAVGAIYLAELLFAFFFSVLYAELNESKEGMVSGLRYGASVWGLAFLPAFVGMYNWSQFPGRLLVYWSLLSLIECVLLGWVCQYLCRDGWRGRDRVVDPKSSPSR